MRMRNWAKKVNPWNKPILTFSRKNDAAFRLGSQGDILYQIICMNDIILTFLPCIVGEFYVPKILQNSGFMYLFSQTKCA